MPEYTAFERGEFTARTGRSYELVYTSGFGLPAFPPDKATFAFVLGGRPEVAIDDIRVDPIDGEIHAFVTINETAAFETIFPLEIDVVPEDSFFAPLSAIGNIAGFSGFSQLDRFRELSTFRRFPESQQREQEIISEIDESNVRNVVSDVTERIRSIGGASAFFSIVILALIFLAIQE